MKKEIKIITSLILFLIAIIFKFNNTKINLILYIISYILVALDIIKKAIKNIIKGELFDENFLMTIATIGAICINEYKEAVAVILFYQIGEYIEDHAIEKSKKEITSLMNIRPDYANLLINNEIKKVDPNKIKIGDTIVVKPGEKIPLDGIVIDGTSYLNMVALTGESIPKYITVNSEVLSGVVNMNGLLKIKVTKKFKESTVSKILALVENASSRKSKSEKFITKFAKYYTPTVLLLALLLGALPALITKTNYHDCIYRALSFLVVSCPCALVLSIPLNFFSGIGASSKMGVLVKGSNYLENLSKIDTVVFDKTGTLTKGIFKVKKINPINITKEELLMYAAHIENYTTHPIGIAIKKAYNKKIDETKIKEIKELPGLGIKAKINNHNVIIGNEKLMEKNKIEYKKDKEAGTLLHIAIDKNYKGNILITDEIKEDAKITITKLKQKNIKKIIMLTGDTLENGTSVGKELGINEIYANLLPQNKIEKLEELLKNKPKRSKIAFVGDGINDSPALAITDVGIAMGKLGSDSAIEAADIVIMTDELTKIINIIDLSRKTMKIVKESIIFAILVKILVLTLIALGASSMWEAVFADVGVTIISVLNSLRLLKVNKKLQIKEKTNE